MNASLVFLDESGLLLAPLVRRNWAPRGHTPVVYQNLRYREKVSCIAALSLSPQRRQAGLYFSLRPNVNLTTVWLRAFLRDLLRHFRNPVVLASDAPTLAQIARRHTRQVQHTPTLLHSFFRSTPLLCA